MGKLADLVGVSRQTVYNELGGKPQLAEAMVMRELELFLDLVDSAFQDNPDDLVARDRGGGVPRARPGPHRPAAARDPEQQPGRRQRAAAAADDQLRGTARGGRPDDPLARDDATTCPLDEHRVEVLIDMVVRLVLSHVMQPSGDPAETAETVAWIAARVLRPRTLHS